MCRPLCQALYSALSQLAAGGRLVFYTDSMNPVENEAYFTLSSLNSEVHAVHFPLLLIELLFLHDVIITISVITIRLHYYDDMMPYLLLLL